MNVLTTSIHQHHHAFCWSILSFHSVHSFSAQNDALWCRVLMLLLLLSLFSLLSFLSIATVQTTQTSLYSLFTRPHPLPFLFFYRWPTSFLLGLRASSSPFSLNYYASQDRKLQHRQQPQQTTTHTGTSCLSTLALQHLSLCEYVCCQIQRAIQLAAIQ
ncbi:hypothetical protein BC939DRAFT_41362 [Gamsiella multidivaricata]|uniref:uncharacterized protein n=1 Tax=Gamsiella multidivaricata TaxID=101098 RepID=UPI0022200955|nr:uncharacterized protein BC939DRAFT_41362 [Gamsiella multidivaricata]KAI7816536.1 hypothetical protein BC939DRAFT_41362 [Gamsiella multidivaricata]